MKVMQRQYASKGTDISVAFYNDQYEINITNEAAPGFFTSTVLFVEPHTFERLVNQWQGLVKEVTSNG